MVPFSQHQYSAIITYGYKMTTVFIAGVVILIIVYLLISSSNVVHDEDGVNEEDDRDLLTQEELEIFGLTRDDVARIVKKIKDKKLKTIYIKEKMERKSKHIEKMVTKYKNLEIQDTSEGDAFYVYEYSTKEKVIYIGKGTVYGISGLHMVPSFKFHRAIDIYAHKECIPYADKIKIEIIKGFDNENNAYRYESELIAHYGLGNLLNKKA